MRRSRTLLLALLLLALAPLPASLAGAVTIVAPSGSDTTEGNSGNSFPFNNFEGRYQQAYDAGQFDTGLLSITEIAFRTDADPAAQGWSSFLTFTVNLSTSQNAVGSLSSTFADNIGADATQVYSAAAEGFGGTNAGGAGPNLFDVVLTLATPFLYNPAGGDLLLEVLMDTNTNLIPVAGFSYLDAVESETGNFDIGLQRVYNSGGDTGALTGTTDVEGFGLVTRFTYDVVPEPGTGLLVMAGLVGLGVQRRRA